MTHTDPPRARRKPAPRDFPPLMTLPEARRLYPRRVWQSCPVCRLAVDPRNRARHVKACARRKRLAPEAWAAWQKAMRP